MFTGIISAIGTVISVDETRGDRRFVIDTPWDMSDVAIGASIACSGCCLTVVEKTVSSFTVDVSAESLAKTSLGNWMEGTPVNLERSLRAGDELGGHIVSGHVDGLATLISITPEGDSHRLKIRVPDGFAHFVAPKGSVALDGISLTLNEVEDDVFGVNIIPHTWTATTLGRRKAGDLLNFEIDPLARYVARMLGK
jgi:riboflavin synthase